MRLYTPANKNGIHGHNALSWALEFLAGNFYLATVPLSISSNVTPEISTVTTTDTSWVPVATGLTGLVKWRLSELNGNPFHYAYVAAPGNDFNVGFGWVSYETAPTAIYIKRPGSSNITIKFEKWSI